MRFFGKQRILAFVIIYIALIAVTGVILYSRYQASNEEYVHAQAHDFNERVEMYQAMQQKMIDNYYGLFLSSPQIAQMMDLAAHSDPKTQEVLRRELKIQTEAMFASLQNFDVRLLFFHLPDQIAFLRAHKPEKFGDSLREARPSIVMAQSKHEKVTTFETGKVFDGFRTIYPLFSDKKFVGTVELAYPFMALKRQLLSQGNGAYTFLIKRSIQEAKANSIQIDEYYQKSPFGYRYYEDKESALENGAQGFAPGELKKMIRQNREIIQQAILKERLEAIKLTYNGVDAVMVLKPVREITGKQAAYMVEISAHHPYFMEQWNQLITLFFSIAVLLALLLWYIYRYNRSTLVLEQYKNAIDENMIISKTDKSGTIIYVNERFLEVSGYDEDEVIGKPHNIVRHPDSESSVFAQMWEKIREGKIWHGEVQNRSKNGESYYLKSTICPIVDENGEVIEYIALCEDVTQLVESNKREEQLRIEAQRSEMTKMEFLANMSHEIRTPLNGIMGFSKLLSEADLPQENHRQAMIISDQSKTLMAVINDILDLSKIESGNLVLESVLVNPFVELENAFILFVPLMEEKGIDYTIRIDNKLSESIGLDILRLKQIMSNLISNALKFTPSGGSIVVEVQKMKGPSTMDRLRFSVTDTGIGIAKEKLASIFTPFTQEDSSTTRQFGGTGLGLSISSKLVELFGGSLYVESEKGKGSRFWFEIDVMECDHNSLLAMKLNDKSINLFFSESPYYESVKNQLDTFKVVYNRCDDNTLQAMERMGRTCTLMLVFEESVVEKLLIKGPNYCNQIIFIGETDKAYPEHVRIISHYDHCPSRLYNALLSMGLEDVNSHPLEGERMQWKGRRVLVAEDYDVNQMLIETLLQVHGITPDFAQNGEEACTLVHTNVYDLVLMDINMPVMDGIEATRLIRPEYPDLPIVALTANALKGDRERFMNEGMNDYLSKPIDPQALERVLQRIFGTPESTEGGNAHYEPIRTEETAMNEPKTSGMDIYYAKMKESLNLPDSVIVRLFDVYITSIPDRLIALDSGIKTLQFPEIELHAHAIKGASANLRLDHISELAHAIELHARNNEEADYATLFANLHAAFSEFQEMHQTHKALNP